MASIVKHGEKWRAYLYIGGKRLTRVFTTKHAAEQWAEVQECAAPTMVRLRAAIEDHRISSALPARMRDAIHRANYSAADIARCAVGVGECVGIYFLLRDGDVVYVGQTDNLLRRLYQHQRDGRRFSAFAFIPCEREHLNELEQTYITLLLPKLNMTFGETRAKKAA